MPGYKRNVGGIEMAQKSADVSEDGDFEVMPLTPLRRLEKRLDAIETTKTTQNLEHFVDKIIDMVELNQKIVDEVVKANQGLREDLAVLIGKMTDSETKLSELISLLKDASETGMEAGETQDIGKAIAPLTEKVSQTMEKSLEVNASILDALASIDKDIKRISQAPQPPSITSSILARRAAQGRSM